MEMKQRIVEALEDSRRGMIALAATVDDERLAAQHDPIMSPLLWDYGHVGVYEELWLVDGVSGEIADHARYHTYDAFENPRRMRARLQVMSRAEVDAYRDALRVRVYDLLDEVDTSHDVADVLTRDGYVYDMVAQHEWQHQETMLQTLQLMRGGWCPPLSEPLDPTRVNGSTMVDVPAGTYPIGAPDHAPYDNEHGSHQVELDAFRIDRHPVSNRRYRAFVEDGGYERDELWSPAGRVWLRAEQARAPKHWRRDGDGWITERFGHILPVRDDEPVVHVCAHEADAYARWAGKRLPTEQEWEVAATWDPHTGRARTQPWGDAGGVEGRANLGRRLLGPSPIGLHPGGASALGCEQMIGDVWEWTSSPFLPYPGFVAFPYAEYSQVFFGDEYRVLRGGSFATHPSVARPTFRNWDYPIRRQIFAGFRCAASADGDTTR